MSAAEQSRERERERERLLEATAYHIDMRLLAIDLTATFGRPTYRGAQPRLRCGSKMVGTTPKQTNDRERGQKDTIFSPTSTPRTS